MRRDEDAITPKPRRRGSGETGKAFGMTALAIMRRPVRIAAAGSAMAAVSLANTLEWLALWQDNAAHDHWLDDDFGAKQDQNFPQP